MLIGNLILRAINRMIFFAVVHVVVVNDAVGIGTTAMIIERIWKTWDRMNEKSTGLLKPHIHMEPLKGDVK